MPELRITPQIVSMTRLSLDSAAHAAPGLGEHGEQVTQVCLARSHLGAGLAPRTDPRTRRDLGSPGPSLLAGPGFRGSSAQRGAFRWRVGRRWRALFCVRRVEVGSGVRQRPVQSFAEIIVFGLEPFAGSVQNSVSFPRACMTRG